MKEQLVEIGRRLNIAGTERRAALLSAEKALADMRHYADRDENVAAQLLRVASDVAGGLEAACAEAAGLRQQVGEIRARALDIVNRRAAVEQLLLDTANGKREVPTREECREWAARLGVPNDQSTEGAAK